MSKTHTPPDGFGSNWLFALFVVLIVAGPTAVMTTAHGTARTVGFVLFLVALLVVAAVAGVLNRKRRNR
jgi:hypothetical protein